MKNPLISIVIPVYNVERYLPLCIDSVLGQEYTNYEVILVDDGSTDHGPEICDSYARSNEQVTVIHKKNAGLGEARNSGLSVAHGEYIYFLDSDDTIQSDTLSTFVNFLNRHGEFSIVGTDFQYVDENNRMAPAKPMTPDEVFDDIKDAQNRFLRRSLIFLAPGTFFNVKWLVDYNLRFKKVPYSEDQLFVWEALSKALRIGFIHKAFYNYLRRPGSIMTATKFEKIIKAYPYFKQLQRQFDVTENLDAQTRHFMLSRWVVGIFHSAAKLCSYPEYSELLRSCEGDFHINNAQRFPDFKIKILTIPYKISSKLYYNINRLI